MHILYETLSRSWPDSSFNSVVTWEYSHFINNEIMRATHIDVISVGNWALSKTTLKWDGHM